MLKIIPISCFAGLCSSVVGLLWYKSLSATEKTDANALGEQMALKLYKQSLAKLTSAQAQVVEGHVQRYVRP